MPTTACPSEVELRDYLLSRTPEPAALRLDEHLPRCPRCQSALARLPGDDTFVAEFRDVSANGPRADRAIDGLVARLLSREPDADATEAPATGTDVASDVLSCLRPGGENELGWLGNYRVLGVLGRGGMGVVLRAEDAALGRLVAVKVMRRELGGEVRERFLREARLAASLNHDHVVPVYHVGEQDGLPFLAMPMLEGESLESRLKREGKLKADEALRIAAEVAVGLAAAHALGLVHRDVKPANLWLEPTGRVKVLDFGLARRVEGDAELTQSGAFVGTPAYAAPEQAGGHADHRADLFSLGCVLYRMLTGKVPFSGATVGGVLASVQRDEPAVPSRVDATVSTEVSAYAMRMLSKKPEGRPTTAREAAEGLRALGQPKEQRKRPRVGWLAAVAAVLLVGVAWGGWKLADTWIVVRDKNDKEVGRIKKPLGGSVTEEDDKKDKEKAIGELAFDPKKIPASERFDWQPKELVAVLGSHRARYWGTYPQVAFSPDGKTLAVGSFGERFVRLWDTATRTLKAELDLCRPALKDGASLCRSPVNRAGQR